MAATAAAPHPRAQPTASCTRWCIMFTIYKLQMALCKTTVRAALLVLTLSLAILLGLRAEAPQDPSPILRTQDIAQITALPAKRAQLEYLLIAAPQSDAPRYVIKLKNDNKLYVVKVPGTTHLSLEREVLLRNNIPYAIARDDYLASHKAVIQDDLIGMEDIKQEVLHLEDMIRNRDLYKEHDIDKPFNVMLTGPAGTGKTKLAGYLAKRLDIPLIQASGSALESGYIGGGSKALHALHRKACARGKCIIFLDEAQGLFMPRGRGEKKWEDDTANTLLGLLDGVRSDKGEGVIWVVASNFDDASTRMDEAMLRRFSVKINFRLPNKTERRELLRSFLARKADGCVDWQDLNLDHVAEITANLSPAVLQTVVERASMLSIQEKHIINTDLMFRAFER